MEDIIIESDESEEFLSRLENSFGMDHQEMGISNGILLEELVQSVITKLDRRTSAGCTSQILFYRVRGILVRELGIRRQAVLPTSSLRTILPKASRRKMLIRLEQDLGITIRYFQAPGWMQLGTLLTLFLSFVWLFINPAFGIMGIVMSLLTVSIAHRVASSLPFKTLGELIDRIWTDNLSGFNVTKGH